MILAVVDSENRLQVYDTDGTQLNEVAAVKLQGRPGLVEQASMAMALCHMAGLSPNGKRKPGRKPGQQNGTQAHSNGHQKNPSTRGGARVQGVLKPAAMKAMAEASEPMDLATWSAQVEADLGTSVNASSLRNMVSEGLVLNIPHPDNANKALYRISPEGLEWVKQRASA